MGIRIYKPTSAGRRNASVNDYAEITKATPEKTLVKRIRKSGGRNHSGKVTTRFRGGGARRMYRLVDFKRSKDGVVAKVVAVEYDPNRTCHIALLEYEDGVKRYMLAPVGLKVGQTVESGQKIEPKVGNCMPLASIPTGLDVHNIELNPGQGGKIVRSAGASARLAAKEGKWGHIILPSGEMRMIPLMCRATIGQVGNVDHQHVVIGKAGRKRHMGRKPHVRGKAMNPVDHPHGGGEGGSSIGLKHPKTPWGKVAIGKKTRKKIQKSNKLIIKRRKKRK